MPRYAVVNASGAVINVAMWDGTTPWQPSGGTAVAIPAGNNAGIGWTYANGTFTAPPPPTPAPLTAAQLANYADNKQAALSRGGFTITLSGTAVTFLTSVDGIALMAAEQVRLGQPNPPTQVRVESPSGTVVTVSAADFTTAYSAIVDFEQATLNTLQSVLSSISSGTITTTAQIDAASWPANH